MTEQKKVRQSPTPVVLNDADAQQPELISHPDITASLAETNSHNDYDTYQYWFSKGDSCIAEVTLSPGYGILAGTAGPREVLRRAAERASGAFTFMAPALGSMGNAELCERLGNRLAITYRDCVWDELQKYAGEEICNDNLIGLVFEDSVPYLRLAHEGTVKYMVLEDCVSANHNPMFVNTIRVMEAIYKPRTQHGWAALSRAFLGRTHTTAQVAVSAFNALRSFDTDLQAAAIKVPEVTLGEDRFILLQTGITELSFRVPFLAMTDDDCKELNGAWVSHGALASIMQMFVTASAGEISMRQMVRGILQSSRRQITFAPAD